MTIELNATPRRLQSVGYSWFVSLPQEWIRHHKLGKHQLIQIEFGGEDELILRPYHEETTTTP